MPSYNRDEFLAEFNIDEAEITSADARIGAYVQGWHLAQMRKNAGLTQLQLAQRLDITQSRISAIEHGDLDSMALATIRAYIEALGGKLRFAAEFGNQQIQFPAAA